jgi:hypothetical protein
MTFGITPTRSLFENFTGTARRDPLTRITRVTYLITDKFKTPLYDLHVILASFGKLESFAYDSRMSEVNNVGRF